MLNRRLAENRFLTGDEYTVADIANYGWYGALVLHNRYDAEEFLDVASYTHVVRWAEIEARPSCSAAGGSEYAGPGAGANLAGIRDPVVDFLIERAQRTPDMETASVACRALDRILLWGFYHIPLNMPDEERFLYWDKFGRPKDAVAIFEYLTDGLARVIDTWWFDDGKVGSPVGLRR